MQQPEQNTALSTHLFSGDDAGFIHTWNDSFTHFAGSDVGAAATFGLTAKKVLQLLQGFQQTFLQEHAGSSNDVISKKLGDLNTLVGECEQLLTNNLQYGDDVISENLKNFGHIPLILTSIAGASAYNRAATTVPVSDINWYFKFVGNRKQISEFINKQRMMKLISEFREQARLQRYATPSQDPAFYFFNALISGLDETVIKPNQKSMPQNETFHRCETFMAKVFQLTCEIPAQQSFTKLRSDIVDSLNKFSGQQAYLAQQVCSADIFKALKNFAAQYGIIDDPNADIEITPQAYQDLKYVLPLIEYITSAHNPFGCNGLLGDMITSPFHTIVLKAYEKHESSVRVARNYFKLIDKPFSGMTFNENQFNDLIFGNEAYEDALRKYKDNKGRGALAAVAGLLTQGNTTAEQDRMLSRDTATQRQVPDQYLMLTYPGSSVNSGNHSNNK